MIYESTIFSARIVNIWNSLPNHVVDVNTLNLFKARLDRFWANQDVNYDFTADQTGIGDIVTEPAKGHAEKFFLSRAHEMLSRGMGTR